MGFSCFFLHRITYSANEITIVWRWVFVGVNNTMHGACYTSASVDNDRLTAAVTKTMAFRDLSPPQFNVW